MRNLKKILALVLALMMTVSLMVVASAASIDDFDDSEKINDTYAEAVEVLASVGIYQGDTEGTFRPQDTLTRAEVATLLYRLLSGDVNGTKVGTWAGYKEFTDVPEDQWYAGYINYAYVKGWVIGNGDDTYGPNDNVTGVELATMLVRALGRDENGNEIGGDEWELQASVLAAKLGLNANLPDVFMSKDATREQTAQMIFNALKVTTWIYNGHIYEPTYSSLIGLKSSYTFDQYYRPLKVWSWGNSVIASGNTTMEVEPLAEYTVAVDQCTVAEDLGLNSSASYQVANNGNATGINATLPANGKGVGVDLGAGAYATGTGVLTQVYASPYYNQKGNPFSSVEYIVVEIDTYLAQVVGTTPAKFDGKGHLEEPATLYLNVYDQDNGTASLRYLTNGATDYAYTAGQMLLLNGVSYSATNDQLKSAAGISYNGRTYYVLVNAEIVDVATSFVGAQSKVYSDNSRDVAGYVEKPSNVQFNHDASGKVVSKTNYTWYMDQYNNLIGSFVINTTYSYGAIENIQWINPETASGYAQATIRYMDGSTSMVKVSSLNGLGLTYTTPGLPVGDTSTGKWVVSTNMDENYVTYAGTALYTIADNGNGTVSLNHVGTRVTSANIVNGVSLINGTVRTDNSTQYLIAVKAPSGVCTFSTVTGYTNVANYTGVIVDYVDLDKDGYADYVYILGDAADVQTNNFVYLDSTDNFYDNDTVTYVFTDAYVNGVQTDIRVNAATFATMTGVGDDTLWYMGYTNGVGSSAQDITNALGTQAGTSDMYASAYTVGAIGEGTLRDSTGNEWNVADTPVYGGEYAVGDKVVIIYNQNSDTSTNFDAVAVYVIGK